MNRFSTVFQWFSEEFGRSGGHLVGGNHVVRRQTKRAAEGVNPGGLKGIKIGGLKP
jgi:hypothetical protein